jgi:hypothetical protein
MPAQEINQPQFQQMEIPQSQEAARVSAEQPVSIPLAIS